MKLEKALEKAEARAAHAQELHDARNDLIAVQNKKAQEVQLRTLLRSRKPFVIKVVTAQDAQELADFLKTASSQVHVVVEQLQGSIAYTSPAVDEVTAPEVEVKPTKKKK